MLAYLPNQPIADELIHLPQIQSFMSGSLALNGIVAMPPGFHCTVASIASILKLQNLTELRLINAVITLICPILFWIYLRLDEAQYPSIRSTQFLLSPIIWPFFFLLYTDLSSLLLLLIGLILIKQGNLILAVVICTISLAFRQNNIFWIALLWLVAIYNFYESASLSINKNALITLKTLKQLIQPLKKTALFLIPFFAFGIFVYLNGGVAMGNKGLHKASGIYPTQIFFCFLVLWIVLLPLHIYNLPAILTLVFKHKIIILGLIILAILYKFSFDISHPYNFPSDYFIRNWMLYKLKDRPIWFLLAFLPMAWALLSIAVTKLKMPGYYWLYPISLISLLPVHLIEQRYYIVPLTLFLLFRLPTSRVWEATLMVWGILLSGLVTYGIASMKIFL
jgi:alpha-1,2-glucosyltransferase